jgi:hypothetical protein
MNASTNRETLVDFKGRIGRLAARGLLAALAGFGCLTADGIAAAQEYVVSDLPENPAPAPATATAPAEDGVIVGLPEESVIQGDMPLFDPASEQVIGDEAGATESMVTDGWSTVGPLAAPTRLQKWTAQVDALFLFMGDTPSRTIYVDDTTGQPALNLNQADPEMSVAPRYAITWHRDACRAFEINYFQVGSFRSLTEVAAPPDSVLSSEGLGGVPFNDVLGAGFESTAGIKSWEFNLRRTSGGPITWIAGFRWVEWTQQLGIADVFDNGGAPGFDAYGVETGNNLYGGQLGADLMLWNRGNRFRVNGVAKGGVYYNYQAYQRSFVFSEQAGLDGILSATKDTTSFVGEVGLTGEYRITNWLSWRAGYTLFWLGGIATPANQLALSDFTTDPPTTGISPYSSVLLHGATTGLEARW